MSDDFNEMVRRADEDYRSAEMKKKTGGDLPYLVTLNFMSRRDAHEFIESIKEYGGVLTMAAGMHTKTVPAGVMDFREWGGETELFGPKWPNHPDRPEV